MKSPLTHFILALTACTIVLVGYGFWYAAVSAKSAAVASLQDQISTKTETISRMAAARATLAELSGDEAVVQGYFVPETGVVAFIDSLESRGQAQGAGVSVLSVSTSGTTAQPALTLLLTVTGTFDAVMRTIGAIEYAPYDISIATLSVGKGDAKDSWRADLKLLVGSVAADTVTPTP